MLLFVLYACLRLLIDLALAPLRDRAAEQAELLVLRHHVAVLERHVKVVRWRQADRLVLATLARRLPRPPWSTLLVTPETVLRWRRELVRRKWATFAGRPRRARPSGELSAVDARLTFELLVTADRMAREPLSRLDRKLINASIKEMRYAFNLFSKYRDLPNSSTRALSLWSSSSSPVE